MLSLNQNFIDAFARGSVEPVFIVHITPAVGTTFTATYGRSTVLSYPEAVGRLTPITRNMNPLTHKVRVGKVTLEFNKDLWFENIITNHRLRNKTIEILIGTSTLAEGDFEPYFAGVIGASLPKDSRYTIQATSALLLPRNFDLTGVWLGEHLLEIIEDIFAKSGMDTSHWVAADYDPTQYGSTISHWNTAAGAVHYNQDDAHREPGESVAAINDLAMLLDAQIVEDEDGKIRMKRFDSSAAIVDTWFDEDMRDFEVLELDGNMINRAEISFTGSRTDQPESRYQANETNSQASFGYPGGPDLIVPHSFSSRWLNSKTTLRNTITEGGLSIVLSGDDLYGFCGLRWPDYARGAPVAQPATAALSGSRVGYIKIDDELIEINDLSVDTALEYPAVIIDPTDGSRTIQRLIVKATATVAGAAQRGVLGTTGAAHTLGAIVTDYTIPVDIAERIIDRWYNGVPIIRCTTNLSKYAVQNGDLLGIVTNRYLAFGKTSLTTAVKWEVMGKELTAAAEGTMITWWLAFAADTAAPAKSKAYAALDGFIQTIPRDLYFATEDGDIGEHHVSNGMAVDESRTGTTASLADGGGGQVVVTTTEAVHRIAEGNAITLAGHGDANYNGTFTATNVTDKTFEITTTWGATDTGTWQDDLAVDVAPGVVTSMAVRSSNIETVALTMNASKDSYIAWDTGGRRFLVHETANGAGQPSKTNQEVWLSKIVTDASVVTGETDLRVTKALNGGKLVASTVDTPQIAPLAVTVTRVAPNAITAPKVNDGAIGIQKLNNEKEHSGGLFANAHVGMFTNG